MESKSHGGLRTRDQKLRNDVANAKPATSVANITPTQLQAAGVLEEEFRRLLEEKHFPVLTLYDTIYSSCNVL